MICENKECAQMGERVDLGDHDVAFLCPVHAYLLHPEVTKKFTLEELRQKVRGIGNSDPGHVYLPPTDEGGDRCSYATSLDRPTQGCLVGQGLESLGVPRAFLDLMDHYQNGSGISIESALERGLLDPWIEGGVEETFNFPERKWLYRVQSAQDGGRMWSQALAHADRCEENEES